MRFGGGGGGFFFATTVLPLLLCEKLEATVEAGDGGMRPPKYSFGDVWRNCDGDTFPGDLPRSLAVVKSVGFSSPP